MNKIISLVADRDSGGQLHFRLSTWPIGVPSKQDTCMCHCQGDTAWHTAQVHNLHDQW